ncbi:hypothetical protein L3X38_042940 [Prunus dulcis]|uniref:Uncharacterized protein n=1 Tax=Prunus dulcis TaxID=3755 RepID=A0AAD4YM09_PRUDU|nr:hypothetical protein L3X38_042940 [Prunus dulcis]
MMGYVHGKECSHYNNVCLHLYKGIQPKYKGKKEEAKGLRYKAQEGLSFKGQDPFLSGEWSSFLGEGEPPPLVVFHCGTLDIAPSCDFWQDFFDLGDDLSKHRTWLILLS